MSSSNTILNFAQHLQSIANDHPDHLAAVIQNYDKRNKKIQYEEITFSELDSRSNQAANGLENFGIRKGVRTVLMVPPGVDFFVCTFALFKIGAIPILVDPGMGIKNLKKCLAEAEPTAFVGVTKAQVARLVLGWGKPTIDKVVTVGNNFF